MSVVNVVMSCCCNEEMVYLRAGCEAGSAECQVVENGISFLLFFLSFLTLSTCHFLFFSFFNTEHVSFLADSKLCSTPEFLLAKSQLCKNTCIFPFGLFKLYDCRPTCYILTVWYWRTNRRPLLLDLDSLILTYEL